MQNPDLAYPECRRWFQITEHKNICLLNQILILSVLCKSGALSNFVGLVLCQMAAQTSTTYSSYFASVIFNGLSEL